MRTHGSTLSLLLPRYQHNTSESFFSLPIAAPGHDSLCYSSSTLGTLLPGITLDASAQTLFPT